MSLTRRIPLEVVGPWVSDYRGPERSAENSEPSMPIISQMLADHDELTAIRRDIHAHPELAFAEQRTADLVAAKLAEFGCEVHCGLAGTGVVGTIRRGNTPAAIGLVPIWTRCRSAS